MNSFYKSIGLYDSLTLSLEMDPSDFTESLRKITYKPIRPFCHWFRTTAFLHGLNTVE